MMIPFEGYQVQNHFFTYTAFAVIILTYSIHYSIGIFDEGISLHRIFRKRKVIPSGCINAIVLYTKIGKLPAQQRVKIICENQSYDFNISFLNNHKELADAFEKFSDKNRIDFNRVGLKKRSIHF